MQLQKNASFISSRGEILLRYSGIYKFNTTNLSKKQKQQQQQQKHEKNGGTKENFKYREDVCFTAYLLSKCWSAETKWNLDKETLNKSCGLNDFQDSLQSILFNRNQVFLSFHLKQGKLRKKLVV